MLISIRVARRSHIVWVGHIKALVNGLEVKKEKISIAVTECDFGKWFYCEGQILLSLFSEHAIKKLENKHKELHNVYMKIYKIYFLLERRSFWDIIFRRKKRIKASEEYNALVYLSELEKISDELITYLNIIERRLNSISEEKFQRLH